MAIQTVFDRRMAAAPDELSTGSASADEMASGPAMAFEGLRAARIDAACEYVPKAIYDNGIFDLGVPSRNSALATTKAWRQCI